MINRPLEHDLRTRVFVGGTEPNSDAMRSLLKLQVERVRTQLTTAPIETVPKLQGEVAAYDNVLKWLTVPVATIVDKP